MLYLLWNSDWSRRISTPPKPGRPQPFSGIDVQIQSKDFPFPGMANLALSAGKPPEEGWPVCSGKDWCQYTKNRRQEQNRPLAISMSTVKPLPFVNSESVLSIYGINYTPSMPQLAGSPQVTMLLPVSMFSHNTVLFAQNTHSWICAQQPGFLWGAFPEGRHS